MKLVTVFNSETIYTGYDPAVRRSILDVLDANKIPYRDKWHSSHQEDRVGQMLQYDIVYRIDVRKADADEAVHLLKQAGIF